MSRAFQLGPGIWTRLRYRVFDAEGEALEAEPFETGCVFGYGALLPALEAALEGKTAGSRCTVELSQKDAFGDRDPDLFIEVERGDFPEGVAPGDRFDAEQKDGIPFVVQVLEVTEAGVLVDMNHPLAGQKVRFEVEVLEARPATSEEVALAEARLEDDPGSDPEGGSEGLRSTGEPLIAPASLLRRGSRR